MSREDRDELQARGRAFVNAFLGAAEVSPDLTTALFGVLEPGAIVHLQNGEVVPAGQSEAHLRLGASLFPDLEVELEESIFPDDRVVTSVRLHGHMGSNPWTRQTGGVESAGAFIARVTPDLRISELWPYVNPAFSAAFPPTGAAGTPPPPDPAAGEASARTLYDRWVQASEGGADFAESVGGSLAPGGIVRLANGDRGGAEVLADLFARISQALHDLTIEIEDVMFDGPCVVAPFRMQGRHEGPIGLYRPTGRVLPSTGCVIARADSDGRAADVRLYVAPAYALTVPPGGSSGGRP